MKKILYLLISLITLSHIAAAQDEPNDAGGKLRGKMIEYIQNKLGLSKSEAEKFQPVFLDYLKEMRATKQKYKPDKLVLQQKIAEVRIRYRDQFKPIVGEKRSNEVFTHEKEFVQKAIQEQQDRIKNRQNGPANKRFKALLQ